MGMGWMHSEALVNDISNILLHAHTHLLRYWWLHYTPRG